MRYAINLFPEKDKDIIDKTMEFAFGYLRYILVITQFVVICVFFFRLNIDQQIVDLKDKLSQKQEILKSTKTLLTDVAKLEEKTAMVGKLIGEQTVFEGMMNYFLDGLPPDFSVTNISIDSSGIVLMGYSSNPASIQSYFSRLQFESRFTTIKLDNIQKTSDGFSFNFNLGNYKAK
jgi:hypothetical protein